MAHIPRPSAVRSRAMLAGAVVLGLLAAALSPATASAAPARSGKVSSPAAIAALRAEVRNGSLDRTHGQVSPCRTRNLKCRYSLVTTSRSSSTPLTTAAPAGWGATELEKAFQLTHAPKGRGLVVIVGIGAYPTLESDLAVYREQYGLPACTSKSGCLTIKNYKGGAVLRPSDPIDEESIAVETSLDVQMVSAACPSCRIAYLGVPVSFTSNAQYIHGFATAVLTAVRLKANAVSMSYGFDTNKTIDTGNYSKSLVQPGTMLFSAVGDYGYMDPVTFQSGIGGWPQNLRSVVSVGGTSMVTSASSPTGYAQTAWDGAGSGCSPDLKPAYGQPKSVSDRCNGTRAVTDIAAVADNLAVYDTYAPYSGQPYGWITVGGTSASSPFMAGVAGRVPRLSGAVGPGPIYNAPASAFTDITTGANGTPAQCAADHVSPLLCKAGKGWDGPTGRGIPNGVAPFERHG